MELDEWLWRNKCTRRKIARAIGIHHQTIFNILAKKRTPCLFTAIAIQKFTGNQVTLEELLNEEDTAKLKKILSA
jgi:DNA-binding XRE family transcriptional regulator